MFVNNHATIVIKVNIVSVEILEVDYPANAKTGLEVTLN